MSGIGPELPPHLLAKRKRQQDEDAEDASSKAAGAKRSRSREEPEKRRKVMGPAMPPAPLDERPNEPPDAVESSSSDDDDDDFGPALPTAGAITRTLNEEEEDQSTANSEATAREKEKPKRDDWMMMPPQQDDLAARLDPSKPRAKGFNTGKGAKGPSAKAGDSSAWHETPEQKQKRLQDEMMGISTSAGPDTQRSKAVKNAVAHDKIQQHVVGRHVVLIYTVAPLTNYQEVTRGPSLLEQHKASKGAEVEDDPSSRAFDREKDMGSGARISAQQKREMLKKADLSGKFAGGSYL